MFARKSAILPLVGINILFFLLQQTIPGFTEMFLIVANEALYHPWTLLTSMFLHGSVAHILFNMYGLFLFGSFLEQKIGWKKLLIVYFTSGLLASIGSVIYYISIGQGDISMLGASGAVMGVVGALILVLPHLRLLFFFVIPMPLWVAGIIFFLIDFAGLFIPSGVANIAHIVGMMVGLGFGWYWRQKQPPVRIIPPSTGMYMNQHDVDEYLRSGRI